MFLPGGGDPPATPTAARLLLQWQGEVEASEPANSEKFPRKSCHEVPENLPGKKAGNKSEVCISVERFVLAKSTFFEEKVDKIFFNSLRFVQLDFWRKWGVMKAGLEIALYKLASLRAGVALHELGSSLLF